MANASPPITRPRVVVVMDDPLAKVLELVLRHGRYEDRVTTDRAEFSRLLREWTPHIILIDLDLHPTFLELSQTGPDKTVPPLVFTRRRQPYPRPAHEARGHLALFQVHRDDPGQGLSLAARFPTRAPELGIRRSRSRQKLERDPRPPAPFSNVPKLQKIWP